MRSERRVLLSGGGAGGGADGLAVPFGSNHLILREEEETGRGERERWKRHQQRKQNISDVNVSC